MSLLRVLSTLVLSITAPAGITSNIIVIATFYRKIHCNDCSYIFFAHLAVIDLLVCIFGFTVGLGMNLSGGWLYCKACLVVIVLFYGLSAGNLCLMTYDRFLYITSPLKYFHKMSAKRAKLLIVILWILCIVNIIPVITNSAYTSEKGPHYVLDVKNCILSKILNKVYFFWLAAVIVIFVVATMIFNLRILIHARRQRRKIESSNRVVSCSAQTDENTKETGYYNGSEAVTTAGDEQAPRRRFARVLFRSSRTKAVRTIMCIVVIHCICNLPYILFIATEILCGFCFEYRRVKYAYSLYLLNYLNSVFDPIIYVSLNCDLRRAVKKMLKTTCCNWRS